MIFLGSYSSENFHLSEYPLEWFGGFFDLPTHEETFAPFKQVWSVGFLCTNQDFATFLFEFLCLIFRNGNEVFVRFTAFLIFTQSQEAQKTTAIVVMLVSQTKEIIKIFLLRVHQHGRHDVMRKSAILDYNYCKWFVLLLLTQEAKKLQYQSLGFHRQNGDVLLIKQPYYLVFKYWLSYFKSFLNYRTYFQRTAEWFQNKTGC